jgi:hypothetical protein
MSLYLPIAIGMSYSRLCNYNLTILFKELQILVGRIGFEPMNSEEDRFTVCCRWPLGYLPN